MLDLPLKGILLVSDMDGTLIGDDGEIPRRNREAVDRFIEKGGLFAVATGRVNTSTRRYLKKISVNAPCITYNGAAIYDFKAEKYLYKQCLPETVHDLLRQFAGKFPDIAIELYCGEQIYVVNHNETTRQHLTYEGLEYRKIRLEDTPRQITKILFAAERPRILELQEYTSQHPYEGIRFLHSSPNYYEGLPQGISKGTTIKVLSELLSVDPSMVMGIGDYYNDLELIMSVAVGAVPSNAPDDLKAVAGVVVGSHIHGAVADFIEYIEHHFAPQFC